MEVPKPPPLTPLADSIAARMALRVARQRALHVACSRILRVIAVLFICSVPILWFYGAHLKAEAGHQRQNIALAIATHNQAIIFAACRAYHRRDIVRANASADAVKVAEVYLRRNPRDSYASAELPALQKAATADLFIVNFDCHTGMLKAEADSTRRTP